MDPTLAMIEELPRNVLVRLLTDACIQCYDSESDDVLRQAVRVNYTDGTISDYEIEQAERWGRTGELGA